MGVVTRIILFLLLLLKVLLWKKYCLLWWVQSGSLGLPADLCLNRYRPVLYPVLGRAASDQIGGGFQIRFRRLVQQKKQRPRRQIPVSISSTCRGDFRANRYRQRCRCRHCDYCRRPGCHLLDVVVCHFRHVYHFCRSHFGAKIPRGQPRQIHRRPCVLHYARPDPENRPWHGAFPVRLFLHRLDYRAGLHR